MAKAPSRGARGRGKGKGKPSGRGSLPKKEPRKRPSAPRGKTYEIICSECYTSYAYSQAASADSISCPECLHVGTVGANDVMSKIAIAKSTEGGNLLKAAIPAVLFFVIGVVWTGMLATKAAASTNLEASTNWIFGGVLAVLFIVTLAFALKYESNRYEVYF